MKKFLSLAFALCVFGMVAVSCEDDDDAANPLLVVDFESVELPENGYADEVYVSDLGVTFENNHANWGSYFAVSSCTDTVTAGYTNEASIFGTGGANGSKKFAVFYHSAYAGDAATISLSADAAKATSFAPRSACFALTTYAALALRDGNDGYLGDAVKLKKDGFFCVDIKGLYGGEATGSVKVYLADWRGEKPYFMTEWTNVDLSALGKVDHVEFTVSGSKDLYGDYGFNAPAYGAMDDFAFQLEK